MSKKPKSENNVLQREEDEFWEKNDVEMSVRKDIESAKAMICEVQGANINITRVWENLHAVK